MKECQRRFILNVIIKARTIFFEKLTIIVKSIFHLRVKTLFNRPFLNMSDHETITPSQGWT